MSHYAERVAAPRPKAGPARQQPRPAPRPPLAHVLQLRAAQSARAAAALADASRGGLPAELKAGVEQLSGIAMDDVRVHRNSSEPAKLGALAYTRGSDIHIGPGQEQHLPHEAWHVVQQKQGRVRATAQMKGAGINHDVALEREADLFGARVARLTEGAAPAAAPSRAGRAASDVLQLKALDAAKIDGITVLNEKKTIYIEGKSEQAKVWRKDPVIKIAKRADLLTAICKSAAVTGNEADKQTGYNWTDTDPVRVRFMGEYKANNQDKALALDYHFGKKWSGYVIHVVDTGLQPAVDKEMRPAPFKEDNTEYGNIHAPQVDKKAIEAEGSADAVTKIAGEGARWQVIGAHAAAVRDGTKIFTNESPDGSISSAMRYVPFDVLWKSWKATFRKVYGISDTQVITELMKKTIRIKTMQGEVDWKVPTAKLSDIIYPVDVSVDDPKPLDATGLSERTASVLYYEKSASLLSSSQTLDQEIAAAKTLVGASVKYWGEGGYMGGDTFAFLCSWDEDTEPADVTGYEYKADTHKKTADYPAYRETTLGTKIKKTVAPPDFSKGASILKKEKEAREKEDEARAANALKIETERDYEGLIGDLAATLEGYLQVEQIQNIDANAAVMMRFPALSAELSKMAAGPDEIQDDELKKWVDLYETAEKAKKKKK